MSSAATTISISHLHLPRLRVLAALFSRDLALQRSYRLALGLDVLFGIAELIVYFFISKTFRDVTPENLEGSPSYFAFAAVGIVLGAIIYSATASTASNLRHEQLTGALEALLTNPVRPSELALGLTAFSFLFALARGILYLAIAGIWLELDVATTDWAGVVVLLGATGGALVALGIIAGAVVLVVKRGDSLTSAVVFALTILGGSVFPRSILPGWLESVANVLPTTFAMSGLRAALFQGAGWGDEAVYLVLYAAVGVPASIVLFRWAINYAKRQGALSGY